VQGQICDILTQASYESLPAPSGHTDSHTLNLGGGGALILDRCRAFNLFASVNAHLCVLHTDEYSLSYFKNLLLKKITEN
jgi:hypothetical protein